MDNGNGFPETFVPARPSRFEATFSHFTIGSTEAGDCPIAVCEIDGEDRSLWLWQTAIRSRFKRLRPKKGERLELQFAGEKATSNSGRGYWPDSVSAPDRPVEVIGVDHPLFAGGGDDADGPAGDEHTGAALFDDRADRDGLVDDHGTPITY
jgi:hypothetical protein